MGGSVGVGVRDFASFGPIRGAAGWNYAAVDGSAPDASKNCLWRKMVRFIIRAVRDRGLPLQA